MNDFLRKLRDLIERLHKQGKSRREIDAEVKRFVGGGNPFPDVRTMSVDAFVQQFAATDVQIAAIGERIAPVVEMAEKASKNFKPSVLTAVQKGLELAAKKGLDGDFREFAREALRPVIKNANHIETEIETAQAALDRAANLESARLAGYEWARYAGPSTGLRKFCAQHLGRIYHITEIEAMQNGQGLSVMYHMGGYNCRHDWEWVTDDVAKAERPDWKEFSRAA